MVQRERTERMRGALLVSQNKIKTQIGKVKSVVPKYSPIYLPHRLSSSINAMKERAKRREREREMKKIVLFHFSSDANKHCVIGIGCLSCADVQMNIVSR